MVVKSFEIQLLELLLMVLKSFEIKSSLWRRPSDPAAVETRYPSHNLVHIPTFDPAHADALIQVIYEYIALIYLSFTYKYSCHIRMHGSHVALLLASPRPV